MATLVLLAMLTPLLIKCLELGVDKKYHEAQQHGHFHVEQHVDTLQPYRYQPIIRGGERFVSNNVQQVFSDHRMPLPIVSTI